MTRFALVALPIVALLACGTVLLAQDEENGEGTLPDVTVRPEDEPTLPDRTVTPDDDTPPTPPPPSPFDLPLSFPDLSQQSFGDGFGGDTGVLRTPGSLFDSARAAAIVPRLDIEEKQAADMFQALQNEVGVLIQSTGAGQASPFIRGLTGQQILILVDGIRMNNSVYRFGPNQYFNTIDAGSVDHVEVLRGPGSVLWGGDAIGGVINVETRGPDLGYGRFYDYWEPEFTQYYNTASSSPYSRLNIQGWAGSTGVFAGGSFLDVRDLDTGWDFGRQPGTNYQQFAGDLKVNYLIDENQMLTVAMQHFEQEDLPRSDRYPGFPGDINGSNTPSGARFFDPQQRDLSYIRYQALEPFDWMDALTFTASYHRQREILTRGVPVTTRYQETDVETLGFNLVASRDLGIYLGRVTFGADWYHDDIDSPFGGTASGPIIPDDAYYERMGLFLNWAVPLNCRWDFNAGLRYENIDAAGTPVIEINGVPTPVGIMPHYDDWVAQAGLTYKFNKWTNFVASFSEGFRAPNLDELMGNNPNVLQNGMDLPSLGLTPEHAYSYEVGIKTNFPRLRTQTFAYWMDLQDNIVPITAGANQFRRANQDSYIQGFEFNGEYLFERGWSAYGNFWYTYGKNLVTSAPLSRIPPTQGIVGLRWRDREANSYFAIYTWLVRRQDRLDPVRDISDERIPPGGTPGYGTLNMRVGHALGCCKNHRLSLSLENITDQPYLVHGSGVFGTGFTARFGYTFRR